MSYIGQQLPADVFSGFTTDSFTGDGSATTFTLSKEPFSEDTLIVVINNVIQKPGTNFTVSGTTLTIVGTAVANGDPIYAIHMGGSLPIGEVNKLDLNGGSDQLILDADADTTISADTDDQVDIKIGGTDRFSIASTGATTITVGGNEDTLILKSTDADASAGPNLVLDRESASPADDDLIGRISYRMRNDAGEAIDLIKTSCFITDASDGAEDTQFEIDQRIDGTFRNFLTMAPSAVIFNEDAQNIDFRVENDIGGNLLNLQAVHGNNSAGTVGINSSNSDGNMFEVINPTGGAYAGKLDSSASSGAVYLLSMKFSGQSPDDNSSYIINARDSSTARFRVFADGDVQNHDNSYGAISDERIKSEIVDANSQWDDIKALKIRNYKKNEDIAKYGDKAWVQIGVIAQELEAAGMDKCVKQEVLYADGDQDTKEYLYTQKDKDQGLIPEGKDVGDVQIAKKANVGDIKEYKGVKYSVLYMKAIKALQEAMAKIETLETKVKALEDA